MHMKLPFNNGSCARLQEKAIPRNERLWVIFTNTAMWLEQGGNFLTFEIHGN